MSDYLAGKALRKIGLGIKVDTSISGIDATSDDLFEVVGGRVLMLQLMGKVTTQIQNDQTRISFRMDGEDISDTPGLDIDNDDVGTNIGITGTVGDAAVSSEGYLIQQATPLILDEGTLDMVNADAARTGDIDFSIIYVPIDDGAFVRAA